MLRMVVDRETFVPFAGPAERLTALDIDDLNRLYQLGFRAGFPASVLDEGVYYGVRVRGRLVSAAGTHAINPREGIAVVGNVMTHVDFRGHDFAKMVTSAVTAELLDRVDRRRAQRPRRQRPGRRGLHPPRLPYPLPAHRAPRAPARRRLGTDATDTRGDANSDGHANRR